MLGVCGAEGDDVWLYRSAQTLLCSGSSTLQRPSLGHREPGASARRAPSPPRGQRAFSPAGSAGRGTPCLQGRGAGGLCQGVFLAVTGGCSLSKLGSS